MSTVTIKRITHAQLVEASPFRVSVVSREGDQFTLQFAKGRRVYFAESRRVSKALQQIEIIGEQEVEAFGIGDFARLVRTEVGLPEPEPEHIDEPYIDPESRTSSARKVSPIYPSPTLFERITGRGRRSGRRTNDPPDLSEAGLTLLGCLLEADEIADEFEAHAGRPLTDRVRRLGITLFIEEQTRGTNHD
jgi:hypothetical protein